MNLNWEGHWIGYSWANDVSSRRNSYFAFRRLYEIDSAVLSAVIRISADARYILWVNNTFIGRGPARCFPQKQSYDVYDITDKLNSGNNCLAVLVYQPGESNYQYIHRVRTGLIIDGFIDIRDGERVTIATDTKWRVRKAEWFVNNGCRTTIPMWHQEWFDAMNEPNEWKTSEYEIDEKWHNAFYLGPVGTPPWVALEERDIPFLDEYYADGRIIWCGRGINAKGFLELCNIRYIIQKEHLESTALKEPDSNGWIVISGANGCFEAITIDYGCEMTAYASIQADCEHEGTVIDIFYNISLEKQGRPEVSAGFGWDNEGICDRVICRKGVTHWESYQPKGFRYQTVLVRSCGVTKIRIKSRRTHYPVNKIGLFSCESNTLNMIWDISDNTLKCGMLDAFVDNSWREQAQWLKDAVVSARAAMALYGDTALIKRGLKQFGQMQMQDGSLYSVVPAEFAFMNITTYNFVWLNGVKEFFYNSGDFEFIAQLRGIIDNLVEWFKCNVTSEGLFLSPEGHQAFIDWARVDTRPYSHVHNLMLISALSDASILMDAIGDEKLKNKCLEIRAVVTGTVADKFWSDNRKAWIDRIEPGDEVGKRLIDRKQPGGWANLSAFDDIGENASLHANALSVLLGLGNNEQTKMVLEFLKQKLMYGETDAMSPLWADKIIESLFVGGNDHLAIKALELWYGRELTHGISTWPEQFGILEPNSDIRAVSCGTSGQTCGTGIISLFTRYILGCRVIKPGWSVFTFDPRPGSLKCAHGNVPTPKGAIEVSWVKKESYIEAFIKIPYNMTALIITSEGMVEIPSGENKLLVPSRKTSYCLKELAKTI